MLENDEGHKYQKLIHRPSHELTFSLKNVPFKSFPFWTAGVTTPLWIEPGKRYTFHIPTPSASFLWKLLARKFTH